jgi:general secretion pathway protein C
MIIAGMVSNSGDRLTVALTTFVVWALVAGSAAYWGLKLSGTPGGSAAAPGAARANAPVDPVAVARLLGASPSAATATPAASVASRFALVGVVASSSHQGAALISIDGKPPKPFRVGAAIDEGVMLQSVDARRAVLASGANGPVVATLELPLPIRK